MRQLKIYPPASLRISLPKHTSISLKILNNKNNENWQTDIYYGETEGALIGITAIELLAKEKLDLVLQNAAILISWISKGNINSQIFYFSL